MMFFYRTESSLYLFYLLTTSEHEACDGVSPMLLRLVSLKHWRILAWNVSGLSDDLERTLPTAFALTHSFAQLS